MSKKEPDHSVPENSRRSFIRKAAWSAPALVTLGVLSGARKADAQDCDPFVDPNCNAPSLESTFREEPNSDSSNETEKLA